MSTATINRIKQHIGKSQAVSNRDTEAMYGTIVLAAMEHAWTDGQPPFPRAVLREQSWIKMKALGFDGFPDWIDLMVGRTEAVPAPQG